MIYRLIYRIILIPRVAKIRLSCLTRRSFLSFAASIYIDRDAKVIIGRNVRIMPGVVIRVLGTGTLIIRDNVNIGRNVTIYCIDKVEIGCAVHIAHNVTIVDHDYDMHDNQRTKRVSHPIFIGDRSIITSGACLLKGTSLGEGVIVGANTVVNTSIQKNVKVFRRASLESIRY